MHEIAARLSHNCGAESKYIFIYLLLSTYILTGCDTASYPYRKGKRTTLKVLTENPNAKAFEDLAYFSEADKNVSVSDAILSCSK